MTKPEQKKAAPPAKKKEDVALVYGKSAQGLNVLRKRDDVLETGVIKPLEEGKPIQGEVVQMTQRGSSPLFDIDVQVPDPSPNRKPASLKAKGGGQVANETYRKNWDSIWKRRKPTTDPKLLN